jgi:TonB family protein
LLTNVNELLESADPHRNLLGGLKLFFFEEMAMDLLLIALSLFNVSHAGEETHTDQQLISESDAYRSVHPSTLTIVKQVAPKFPKKAHKQGYRHEECTVQFYVDDVGKPDEVAITGACPEVFHSSLLKVAKKWRFAPVIGEGSEPEPVTFVLRFRFEQG